MGSRGSTGAGLTILASRQAYGIATAFPYRDVMRIAAQDRASRLATGVCLLSVLGVPVLAADPCSPRFNDRLDHGAVTNVGIVEASGLAASRVQQGVYYTHNDSGHTAKVYAIDEQGQHLCTFVLGGWSARDWEDIAVGPGPDEGRSYVYVSDTGDNEAKWPSVCVLRMAEPISSGTPSSSSVTVTNYDVIRFVYPDGPRDAETLMVDPLTRDLYIVTKREPQVRVYRLPYPQSTSATVTAQHVATLNVSWIAAGDISPSGYEILIKNGSTIYHWCRQAGQTIAQAMSAQPLTVPYTAEPQGEALCWNADGSGYLSLSEGASQHLYYYGRAETETPPGTDDPSEAAGPGYTKHDYNGDGMADLSVFWGKKKKWYIQPSGAPVTDIYLWGDLSAIPVPGDYDGDGSADLVTYHPKTAVWRMFLAVDDVVTLQFGSRAMTPAPADYDGDGVTDIAVFHAASGTWHLMMSTAGYQTRQFGWSATTPVPADYDGDGKDDLAVFHPMSGTWYLLQSRGGYLAQQFGFAGTQPVPADYDGDGKVDLGVYHAATGNWYLSRSRDGFLLQQFGWKATTPVPADFDGDGRDDIAVYHQARGSWYVMQSQAGFRQQILGSKSTEPVASDPAIWINH
jgi:hypothetical protein